MKEKEAKQLVIQAGKELVRSGLIARTWGNVSCRLNDKFFLITASGRDYRTLSEDEVIRVSISDLSYEGDILPSSEKKIHREIYRMKEDAGFVIHTHQDHASAVSAMGIPRIELDREYQQIGSCLICAEYGLSGTDRLCSNVKKALEASAGKAVILKNHGAVCYGSDYEEAFRTAHILEEACGVYLKRRVPGLFLGKKEQSRNVGDHIVWNRSRVILDFAERETKMRPYLDDFAQIAGRYLPVLPRDQKAAERAVRRGQSVIVRGVGAFLTGDTGTDAMALSMITEKNAMAYFAARATGGRPVRKHLCVRMRRKYLRSYSRRIR